MRTVQTSPQTLNLLEPAQLSERKISEYEPPLEKKVKKDEDDSDAPVKSFKGLKEKGGINEDEEQGSREKLATSCIR